MIVATEEMIVIELTEQQIEALAPLSVLPPHLLNPQTRETFVLLRIDEYERLKRFDYDDGPWTSEERHALAWEAGRRAGWDTMDEYDLLPDTQ